MPVNPPLLSTVVNMDSPGRYLHWSIFTVSVANLALVAVMVVIFALALVFPFPHGRRSAADEPAPEETGAEPDGGHEEQGALVTNGMWTAAVRERAVRALPPQKLLPDRQPAYVASWVYTFGVAALVTLGLAIVSGFAIALGGVDWWHSNPLGHFFNSLHLWSVELFMALMVIHLWGKFFMAAWRGRRALTWITGVLAFGASVVECFTGYLSQQNFDSQWISTNGKDAINATGAGSFFNLMNVGQMLLWHVVLLPIVLVAIVAAHVLLVRMRGVSHPLPLERTRTRGERREQRRADAAAWRGPTRRYDILKEGALASMIALALVVVLAVFLSSPDVPAVTVANWARVAPADFLGTAASELAGTSRTAQYGPPYNGQSASVQGLFGVSPQKWLGVGIPIDAPQTFVLGPLQKLVSSDPPLAKTLHSYESASTKQQLAWANAYLNVETKVKFVNGAPVVPKANDGPVPALMTSELTMARSGALDANLLAQAPFYGTNFTKPLLFIEDGSYFSNLATADHLTGSQWGVMNETGSYPGQPWLWLYTLWYQLPGFSTSANVDLIAICLTAVATILLLAVPFVPGLRDIPRYLPLPRLIWKQWYRESGGPGTAAAGAATAAAPSPAQPAKSPV